MIKWAALLREHTVGDGTCALVHVGVPVAVAKVIGIAADPGVDTISGRVLLIIVKVWFFLVVSVKCNLRRVRDFLALCVVLDNLPVLCDRDVNVTEFDLALYLFLDLSQTLPLDRKLEAVTTPRVYICNYPHIVDIGRDYLLESLQTELLLIVPVAL